MRVVQHKTPQKEEKTPPPKPTEEEVQYFNQCFASGIRCLFDPWIWDLDLR